MPVTCASCGATAPASAQRCPTCGKALVPSGGYEDFTLDDGPEAPAAAAPDLGRRSAPDARRRYKGPAAGPAFPTVPKRKASAVPLLAGLLVACLLVVGAGAWWARQGPGAAPAAPAPAPAAAQAAPPPAPAAQPAATAAAPAPAPAPAAAPVRPAAEPAKVAAQPARRHEAPPAKAPAHAAPAPAPAVATATPPRPAPAPSAPPPAPAPAPASIAPAAAPAPAPAAPVATPRPASVAVSGDIVKPRLQDPRCVMESIRLPRLPEPFSGVVTVKFQVGVDGSPTQFEVVSGAPSDKRIPDAIWDAVKRCRFVPGSNSKGEPLQLGVVMPIKFG